MRELISLGLTFIFVLVAVPAFLIAFSALTGGLADVGYSENVRIGLPYLCLGGTISLTLLLWIWFNRKQS